MEFLESQSCKDNLNSSLVLLMRIKVCAGVMYTSHQTAQHH